MGINMNEKLYEISQEGVSTQVSRYMNELVR